MKIVRLIASFSLLAFLVACASLALLPLPAQADGGAPNLAYVAGGGHGVSVIDIAQRAVTSNISVGGDPHMLYLTIDGRFLFVTQPALGQVTMLSTKTQKAICTARVPGQPSVMSYDTATNTIFVGANNVTGLTQIDATTCKILHTLSTPSPVNGVAIANTASPTDSGDQLWVATATTLLVFDTSSLKQLANIAIKGEPENLVVPQGTNVYVSTRSGDIDAVDISSFQATKLLSGGGSFGTMDYDAVTGEIYVPDQLHKQLDVLTPPSPGSALPPEPGHIYHLSAAPQAVAVTSDGQLAFVALNNGDVVMIDVPGQQIAQTIHVGGAPRFIITGLYPPGIATTPQQAALANVITTVIAVALVLLAVLVPLWFILWSRKKRRTRVA